MPTEFVQVNTSMPPEVARMLDRMSETDGFETRSAFIRWLIRQEWARRYSQPNPLVSVGEAEAANEWKPEIYPTEGE